MTLGKILTMENALKLAKGFYEESVRTNTDYNLIVEKNRPNDYDYDCPICEYTERMHEGGICSRCVIVQKTGNMCSNYTVEEMIKIIDNILNEIEK